MLTGNNKFVIYKLIREYIKIAKEMLNIAGINKNPETGLKDGSAYETWKKMIQAQGGDPEKPIPVSNNKKIIKIE